MRQATNPPCSMSNSRKKASAKKAAKKSAKKATKKAAKKATKKSAKKATKKAAKKAPAKRVAKNAPAIVILEDGLIFLVDKAEKLQFPGKTVFASAVCLGFLPLQQGSLWLGEQTVRGKPMTIPHPAVLQVPKADTKKTKELSFRAVNLTKSQASALLSVCARQEKFTLEGVYDKATGRREYRFQLKPDKRQKFSILDMCACVAWNKFNQLDLTWVQRAEWLSKNIKPITAGALKMRAAQIGLTLGA